MRSAIQPSESTKKICP